jgi:hypothetical protein
MNGWNGGLRVEVEYSWLSFEKKIWVFSRLGPDTIRVYQDGGASVVDVEHLDGQTVTGLRPFITLSPEAFEDLMPAVVEALTEKGIQTPSQHQVVATLDAQSYHLEDLRRLLKLPPKPATKEKK